MKEALSQEQRKRGVLRRPGEAKALDELQERLGAAMVEASANQEQRQQWFIAHNPGTPLSPAFAT